MAASRPATSSVAAVAIAGLRAAARRSASLYWVDEPLTRDEREYLSLARSLAAGHGFVYDDALLDGPVRAVRPRARLSGVSRARRRRRAVDRRRAVVASRSRSRSSARCGVLIVGLLAGRLGGRSRRGDRGARSPPCYPPLVWIAAYAFSEALFWPLGLARRVARRPRRLARRGRRAAVLARSRACSTGLAMLVRPATIVFFVLAALWLLWRRRSRAWSRSRSGAALVIAPVDARATSRTTAGSCSSRPTAA